MSIARANHDGGGVILAPRARDGDSPTGRVMGAAIYNVQAHRKATILRKAVSWPWTGSSRWQAAALRHADGWAPARPWPVGHHTL